MKKSFFSRFRTTVPLTATFFLTTLLLFSSCNESSETRGEKFITEGNITLHSSYMGYGKDSDGHEDILVHYYESGDLSTFIKYSSAENNSDPYIIKTSNQGADSKSNNIIKMELTFATQIIESILVNIELEEGTRTSQFYMQTFLDDKEVSKTSLSGGEKSIAAGQEINRILIYIDAPKFNSSNGEKTTGTFKFNCCLPYAEGNKPL